MFLTDKFVSGWGWCGGWELWMVYPWIHERGRVHGKFTKAGHLADGNMTWQMGRLWSFHLATVLYFFSPWRNINADISRKWES